MSNNTPLGIVAGGGDLPRRLIDACTGQGRPFFVIAFRDQTDPETVVGTPHVWLRLGAAGEALSVLRDRGVGQLVMAGRIRRPSLAALRPDAFALKVFAKAGLAAFGDDGILKALVAALEEEGLAVIGPEDVLADLLATEGTYGSFAPDDAARADIAKGIAVARGLGALDVGQAAVVQQGLVLGVEAIEGTDALLARCGELRREGSGGVLVKVKKPNQERRADLPTIGPDTVAGAARAGLAGIAVEAGGALVVDRAAVIAAADGAGLFVVGVRIPS